MEPHPWPEPSSSRRNMPALEDGVMVAGSAGPGVPFGMNTHADTVSREARGDSISLMWCQFFSAKTHYMRG
jgi:hypothetical protein